MRYHGEFSFPKNTEVADMGINRSRPRLCHSSPQLDMVISPDRDWNAKLIPFFTQNLGLDLSDEEIFSDLFTNNN